MLPWGDDGILATWLDGRNFAGPAGGHDAGASDGHDAGAREKPDPHGAVAAEMTLRCAVIDPTGRLSDATLLDGRTCDCCQTSAVRTANGAVIAYRDRSENEVRDISYVRYAKGSWSKPRVLHGDGWQIHGCPVNGPALAAAGNRVAAAWFTNANDTPRVKVAFSHDEGKSFDPPVVVDDGDPLGRVDLIMFPHGDAMVSWLEATGDGAVIRVRYLIPNGQSDPSFTVGASSEERASGFPRMAYDGQNILIAWTEPSQPRTVRVATIELDWN
jgi:hypothetical protein